jgi:dTDP-4-dehydrorhamnose reductase
MKILLLGYKGMLGHDLYAKLSADHEVVGKDIDDFNIVSLRDCHSVVEETNPDVVINAAAYTDVDGCETNSDKCFRINAEGVNNIGIVCKERNLKVVHFSTDYIFDGTKGEPYIETDAPNPINTYGHAKLQGELYLRALAGKFLIIRTSWLYGKNGKNFVKAILDQSERGKLSVVNDQIGSPTYTVDLAGAVKTLIEEGCSGIYNITNRGRCSWYDFALKILEYAGKKDVEVNPISTGDLARKALRPSYSVLSCKKFATDCKKTMRFWQIALKDYVC